MSLPAQGAGYDSTPADVQAYDVRTGKIAWVFHSIPHPGEFGYDTWPEGAYKKAGGVHNWSELTVDEQNGIAFIPFGTARFDFYGGDRGRRQPVREQPRGARCADGQAPLAPPARAPRSVGLRPAAGAEAADASPERPQHRRRRAGHEVRLHLRVRAQDRQADLPDRRASGSAVRRAGRAELADAAVPDEACAVRAAVVHREGHQSVSARSRAGVAATAAAQREERGALHAAESRGLDRAAGSQRRRELGQLRGRSDSGASSTSSPRTCRR